MYWGTTRLDRLEQNDQLYQQSLHAINRFRGLSESCFICAGNPRVTAVVSRPHARLRRSCRVGVGVLHIALSPVSTTILTRNYCTHLHLKSRRISPTTACSISVSSRTISIDPHESHTTHPPHVVANRDPEQHLFWNPSSPNSANDTIVTASVAYMAHPPFSWST
jgi:hypothetical protein